MIVSIKNWLGLAFTVALLAAVFFPDHAFLQEAAPEKAYVDVSVSTVWVEPDSARDIDEPALGNPVDHDAWTESMTYEEKLWLVGNLETQALYGMEVSILEEEGDWAKVAVHGQETPREELGYPGWVPKEQLTKNKQFEKLSENKPFATVTSAKTNLYLDRQLTDKVMELSFNTRLPVLSEQKKQVLVAVPAGGVKWLDKEDVEIYNSVEDIPEPGQEDLVETGKMFLDLPYLWAGVSAFGFDCSGFTHTIYKAHGIEIPRDSGVQAQAGEAVDRDDLQVGDLVYFARDGGTGAVHHIGMYIGNGEMIHSPNTASTVEIAVIEESGYEENYAGARRILETD
ncbi:NlpC/P60 family protein [Alteribacillus sp. HJP-4]|uniref:C40 family peptidase n=1 Tax=Alteribacillus sp. HJP-4 TaxID=2775394 RepID=UPI0035CCE38A